MHGIVGNNYIDVNDGCRYTVAVINVLLVQDRHADIGRSHTYNCRQRMRRDNTYMDTTTTIHGI